MSTTLGLLTIGGGKLERLVIFVSYFTGNGAKSDDFGS
jgi:hypothetical protein